MSTPLLTVTGVSKRFGGLQALSEVELTIQPGQIHGLIGPNGAGKTTFFNVITGLVPADRGRFTLAGRAYRPTEVHKVAQAGIARTFQNIRLFADMSALDNVRVGRHVRTKVGWWQALLRTRAFVHEEAMITRDAQALLDLWACQVSTIRRRARSATATSVGWRSHGPWPPNPSCWRWTSRRPA